MTATPIPSPLPTTTPVVGATPPTPHIIYVTVGGAPPPPFVAAGVLWWEIVVAAVIGLGLGFLSGRLAVWLERIESLETEEIEERDEAQREWQKEVDTALKKGDKPPAAFEWLMEKYGSTWLERWLSPVLTAGLLAILTLHDGVSRLGLIQAIWVVVLVHIALFDFKHRLVLNRISYPAIVLALALSPLTPGLGLWAAFQGAAILGVAFVVLHFAFRGGLGLGDAKLVAFIGAVLGFNVGTFQYTSYSALFAICYGVFAAGAVAVFLITFRIRGRKDPIPYAPFLCAGAVLVIFGIGT